MEWLSHRSAYCPGCGARGVQHMQTDFTRYRCPSCGHRWKMQVDPSPPLLYALSFVERRREVRSRDLAFECEISIQSASTRLFKLFRDDFLIREYDTAPSGGPEYVFRARPPHRGGT